MRIGTRITLTTSLLVATTLGTYGYVSLRSRHQQDEALVTRQAVELGASVRAAVETMGFEEALNRSADLTRSFERAGTAWSIAVLDARNLPGPEQPPSTDETRERLRHLATLKVATVEEAQIDGRPTFIYMEPVRAPKANRPGVFEIVGAIQVSRNLEDLRSELEDQTVGVVGTLILLIVLLLLAISILVRRGMGHPINQLLHGIDGVAKGDLSHVLFQERDDEIGDLAGRFNDMTASLREAREETRRGLQAKLSLEEQLRRSEKLATIGQLAAEIAHEVGTPLSVVAGRARALAKKADDREAVQKNGSIIAEQAARITRIIQRLLDFSRRRVDERGPVDVNRLAQDTLEFLEHQLATNGITVDTHPDASLPPLPASKDQLQQVLLNLFMNAIQAMPRGGRLSYAAGRVERRRPGLEADPEQEYAVLEVRDTGVGIPAEDREKIFEPFYTSKSDDGGSGLGLAVAHGIVKDHDGWIELDDNDRGGRGTVFRVFLPLRESQSQAQPPMSAAATSSA